MTAAIVTWVSIVATWIGLFVIWRNKRKTYRHQESTIASLCAINDMTMSALSALVHNAAVQVNSFDRTRLTIEVDARTWSVIDRTAALHVEMSNPLNDQEGQAR